MQPLTVTVLAVVPGGVFDSVWENAHHKLRASMARVHFITPPPLRPEPYQTYCRECNRLSLWNARQMVPFVMPIVTQLVNVDRCSATVPNFVPALDKSWSHQVASSARWHKQPIAQVGVGIALCHCVALPGLTHTTA